MDNYAIEETQYTVADLPDPENEMSPEDLSWLNQYLNEGETYVNFTKLNGEVRDMRCTINLDLIPKESHPTEDSGPLHRNANPNIKTVFDLDLEEWRSFRLDRVNWFEQGE